MSVLQPLRTMAATAHVLGRWVLCRTSGERIGRFIMITGKSLLLATVLASAPAVAMTANAQVQRNSMTAEQPRDRTTTDRDRSMMTRDMRDRDSSDIRDRDRDHRDMRHYGWRHGHHYGWRHCGWRWHHHHRVRICGPHG
jgi:hypothetical protein